MLSLTVPLYSVVYVQSYGLTFSLTSCNPSDLTLHITQHVL